MEEEADGGTTRPQYAAANAEAADATTDATSAYATAPQQGMQQPMQKDAAMQQKTPGAEFIQPDKQVQFGAPSRTPARRGRARRAERKAARQEKRAARKENRGAKKAARQREEQSARQCVSRIELNVRRCVKIDVHCVKRPEACLEKKKKSSSSRVEAGTKRHASRHAC